MNSSIPIQSRSGARRFPLHRLALFMLILANVAAARPAGLGLSETLSKLDQSPVLRQAVTVYQQAQADLAVAQARAGVQVKLETKSSNDLVLSSGANTFNTSLQLGLSVPLAPQSALVRTAQIAELALKSADAQLRLARANLARCVVRAYGQVLSLDQARGQSQLRLELAQFQASAFEERVRVGTATQVDSLNAQLALGSAQQDLARAEFTVRDARVGLAGLIGRSDLPGPLLPPDAPAVLPDLGRLRGIIGQAPGMVFAQVNLETARLNVLLAELQSWSSLRLGVGVVADRASANVSVGLPDLSAQASLGYQLFGTPSSAAPTFNVTLNLGLPIWDSGIAAASQGSANLNVERTRVELEQASQDVLAQLTGTLELARLDDASLPTQRAALEVAQRSLEATQARFVAGSVTALEVLAARVQLSIAEGTLLSTQLRVLEDRYQVYVVLGVGGLS